MAEPELPEDEPERWLLTCTAQTPVTQDALGHVHDRPPVIISKHLFVEWLRPDPTDRADVQHLMESLPEPTLTPRVNSTGQQRPELMNQLRGASAGKVTSSGHP
nr:SOS response-associated peptidase family protein [Paenarthrobacter nitroguajacolicus]